MTYRYLEHCGIHEDFELGYRTEQEAKEWHKKDPLKNVEDFVEQKEKTRMEAEIASAIDKAYAYAKASPFPQILITEDTLS